MSDDLAARLTAAVAAAPAAPHAPTPEAERFHAYLVARAGFVGESGLSG